MLINAAYTDKGSHTPRH